MPLQQFCLESNLKESVSNGQYGHNSVDGQSQVLADACTSNLQDSSSGCFTTAAFTHIASMTESLDDLLAGEIEPPAINEETYCDDLSATQAYSTLLDLDEVDPVIMETARLDYERYLDDAEKMPIPTPRIERVNEPDYFISKGVITGTSYPIHKNLPATPRKQTRNSQLQNTCVPDFNLNTTIWETREERLKAIDHQHIILNPRARLSEFFVWGVSYNPPSRLSQGYRAVHIEVPTGASLKSVLNCINTGAIYSATICDTVKITGFLTAFIVFVDESGAVRLKSNVAGKRLNPIHITTHPTWPISSTMVQQIRQGWTRCLSIKGLPYRLSSEDVFDMMVQPGYSQEREVLEVQRDGHGNFRVEFSSIAAADRVYKSIYAHYNGTNVMVRFGADPCSPHQPVPFAATPDNSPTTLTPPSSFGSQCERLVQDNLTTSSLVSKYGPPPSFRMPGLPLVDYQRNLNPVPEVFDFANNQEEAYESDNEHDAEQYKAATLLMKMHEDDALISAQLPKANLKASMACSNLVPTFEYHGSELNWADEMIDEAVREEHSNASAIDGKTQLASGWRAY